MIRQLKNLFYQKTVKVISSILIPQNFFYLYKLQKENETKYNKALIDMKDELREKEGEEIAEKLKGKIREWFQTEQ